MMRRYDATLDQGTVNTDRQVAKCYQKRNAMALRTDGHTIKRVINIYKRSIQSTEYPFRSNNSYCLYFEIEESLGNPWMSLLSGTPTPPTVPWESLEM